MASGGGSGTSGGGSGTPSKRLGKITRYGLTGGSFRDRFSGGSSSNPSSSSGYTMPNPRISLTTSSGSTYHTVSDIDGAGGAKKRPDL